MDATFGTVKKGWSFYVILIVDGEGESIVVSWFLLRDYSFKSLFPIFEYLSNFNNFSKRDFFFTDKDCSERGTVIKFFDNAALGLCFFHVMKNFKERMTKADGYSKKEKLYN